MRMLANWEIDKARDNLKCGKSSGKPRLGKRYILAIFQQERFGRTRWAIELTRNGSFCGVVQRRDSDDDYDKLMRAVGRGYKVGVHVVSTGLSRDPTSGERVLVGKFTWRVMGHAE
jgi:hypothetical protein